MATRHDHGHTAAAWTAVLIIIAGFFLGAIAVALLNWPLFWASVGVIVLGLVVGKVMQMMGLGRQHDDGGAVDPTVADDNVAGGHVAAERDG